MSVRTPRFPTQALIDYLRTRNKVFLSELLNVDRNTIYRWEAGGTQIGLVRAERFAEHLGVHPSEIWPEYFSEPTVLL